MKTRVAVIIGIVASIMMLIGFTYYTTDFTKSSETEQECDMEIRRAQYTLDFANSTYRNQYVIKDGCVSEISHNPEQRSLVISFHKTRDGTIQIILPEFFYESRPKSEHIVLADGKQTEFEQLAPSALQINFTENTKTLKIIDFMSTPEFTSITVDNSDKNNMVQIKKILYFCDANERKPGHIYQFSNSTHYIDSDICEWQKNSVLIDIVDRCDQINQTGTFGGFAYGASWQNSTHYIDNFTCEWNEK